MKFKEANIDGETIYIKKDWMGYRVIEPIKDPKTNQIIWKNILNKKGFLVLGFILLILGLGYLGFSEQVNNYREVMNNPCSYCEDSEHFNEVNPMSNINISNIKFEP